MKSTFEGLGRCNCAERATDRPDRFCLDSARLPTAAEDVGNGACDEQHFQFRHHIGDDVIGGLGLDN
jgi:hypothetical protein